MPADFRLKGVQLCSEHHTRVLELIPELGLSRYNLDATDVKEMLSTLN